jgi:protein-tyrosine kinase
MNTLTKDSPSSRRGRVGAVAEQYYGLFHWLQSIGTPTVSDTKTIGVTSCGPESGAGTVAANLALAAAHASKQPVLLVDLSGTRSKLAERLRMYGDLGLHAALASDVRPADCVKGSPIENLFLLAANDAGMSESLSMDGGKLHQLLQSLESDFKFIVVDLPPADTALCFAVAGAMSGVLLVMDAEQTRYDAAVRAKQRLLYANAALLGVILNENSYRPPF